MAPLLSYMATTTDWNDQLTPDETTNNNKRQLLPIDANTILQGGGELAFMKVSPKEAPFLVGMKGRNISLIRKCTGMVLTIKDETVTMTKQRPSAKPALAVRMVLSACCGGILRWFVTQAATAEGYPLDKIHSFEQIALKHKCILRLLRARNGHMCLMLIPDLPATPLATDADQALFRDHLAEARKELLLALLPASPSTTTIEDPPVLP